MDQIVVKVDDKDFENINVENKVIIFDEDIIENSIVDLEKSTNVKKEELFFYVDKSSRVERE